MYHLTYHLCNFFAYLIIYTFVIYRVLGCKSLAMFHLFSFLPKNTPLFLIKYVLFHKGTIKLIIFPTHSFTNILTRYLKNNNRTIDNSQ
jgi:hypothetical protein